MRTARLPLALLAAGLLVVTAACGSDDASSDATAAPAATTGDTVAPAGTEATSDTTSADTEAPADSATPADTEAAATPASDAPASDVTLRLGYFPNVTHAPAIIGVDTGLFTDALGSTATLETSTFNSGTEVVEAIFSGALDATLHRPEPGDQRLRQVQRRCHPHRRRHHVGRRVARRPRRHRHAGRPHGQTLATPSARQHPGRRIAGLAARAGLQDRHERRRRRAHHAQENADTLAAFQSGALDGAWVPEPWATRLVLEGGGNVLVDEADLWPNGEFVTTHLIVATEYLNDHPDVIKALIVGLADSIDVANGDAPPPRRPSTRGSRRSPRSPSVTTRSPAPGRT